MELSVIVPTFNEAPNIAELVRRAEAACAGIDAEIVFVDDSRDETPKVIAEAAARSTMPVRLIHRDNAAGGLSGAVIKGVQSSQSVYCLVMDGDLQHPPELIPVILRRLQNSAADAVIASRYCGNGRSYDGFSSHARRLVSSGSTTLTRSLFPSRLRECSDPMTGFFGFRRSAVKVEHLKPSGFKILLEILIRHRLRVEEVPFNFGARFAGESKATVKEDTRFVRQLLGLRFGRIASFGVVGGVGAVLNLLIMAMLMASGVHYVVAAIIAAEATILSNFLMQERMVFHADRGHAHPMRRRFFQSFSFNNIDAAVRLPFLWVLVEFVGMNSIVAQAGTLGAAFLLRYLFHSRIVYGPVRTDTAIPLVVRHQPARRMVPIFGRQRAEIPPA